jgi:MFS family permease
MTGAIPLGAVIGGLLLNKAGIRPVMVTGLVLASLGLFLVGGWDLDVGEPQLTLHLAVAGLGFGLVISPIMTQALTAVSDDYRATAAALVVVARMLGMTLGLAALSAWGVEHFQTLTSGLEFPLPQPGDSSQDSQARLAAYTAGLNDAGLALFHNFLRVAAVVLLAAVPPALAKVGGRHDIADG